MKDAQTTQGHSRQYVAYVIVLLAVVYACNYMDRMAFAVLAPLIKTELALSDTQLGLMGGLAFSLFFALCGIPFARWADRGTRRNIIAIALSFWSAMTALSGAAQNGWLLFLARMGMGVGEAGCVPPSHSMLCDYVPLKRRPVVFAINQSGVYGGMMLGMALAGTLSEIIGWRWTFVALGTPGIALAALVRLTLREPARGFFDTAKSEQVSSTFGETLRALWRCRTYRWITLFCIANGFVQIGMNQWWPSFYARVHGVSLSAVGVFLGLAIGIGSGTGLLIGGVLANRFTRRDVRWPIVLGAVATVFAVPMALASLFAASFEGSVFLIALTTLFWSVSNGPVMSALYSVTESSMRATAGAMTIFSVSVLGYTLGPWCIGFSSDWLAQGFGPQSLRYALLGPICVLPVMAYVLYRIAQQLPADLPSSGAEVEQKAAPAGAQLAIEP